MNFTQIFQKLNADYQSTASSQTSDAYGRLSTIFEELGKLMREHIQELTTDDIKSVIVKLKSGKHITSDDKEKIKLWVVGDAQDYANAEQDLHNWQKELRGLMDKINALQVPNPDVHTVSKLRGLLRDAARVTADLLYLAAQKERLDRFSVATEDIDPEERELLVRLLEQKMKSPNF